MISQHPHVLFICTGNIFRSMTAEFALRSHAQKNNIELQASSAGLIDAPHGIVDFVAEYLQRKGMNSANHSPRKLDQTLLNQATIAIAMDLIHRDYITQEYHRSLPLFNELAYDTQTGMPDVDEVVEDWQNNHAQAREYGHSVMDSIWNGMPNLVQHLGTQVSGTDHDH